jgi:hypothetical protein
MHCLHGQYDYLVNDQFELYEWNEKDYCFSVPTSNLMKDLFKNYLDYLEEKQMDLEFIYLIESSLFLSMTSLHYENKQRQKVMYLTGVVLLNQVLERNYAYMY